MLEFAGRPPLLGGLVEVEGTLQTSLNTEQNAVMRPPEAVVLGKVNDGTVVGFYRQRLWNVCLSSFASQWLANCRGR
ncbi:MAG: hypothetical protein ABSH48_25385 [Verrucomicrobiota bacterium]